MRVTCETFSCAPSLSQSQTLVFFSNKLLHHAIWLHSQSTAAFPHGTCLHPANTGCQGIFDACSAMVDIGVGMRCKRRAGASLLQSKNPPCSSSLLVPSGMGEKGWSPGDGIPVEGHLPNRQCGWLAGTQWYQRLIQRASSWSQSICHPLWLPNKSSVKVRELWKLQRPEVALVLPFSSTDPKW